MFELDHRRRDKNLITQPDVIMWLVSSKRQPALIRAAVYHIARQEANLFSIGGPLSGQRI